MPSPRLHDLDTPALVVDLPTLRANIDRVARSATAAGLEMRPHCKAHKTPEIAHMQLDAGAAGVTASKVSEAEAMVDGGVGDVFIANEVVGGRKLARLRALNERASVSVACDSVTVARGYSEHVGSPAHPLEVIVEVDIGAHRCGVQPEGAADLADAVAGLPGLEVVGVMGYAPMTYSVTTDAERVPLVAAEGRLLLQVADELRGLGHDVRRISGGCTPAAPLYGEGVGLTEIRPGTYVFYDRNQVDLGVCEVTDISAAILTTVISLPSPGRAIVDAGSKALANQVKRVSPGYGFVRGGPGGYLDSINDEHGYLNLEGASREVRIGEKLELIPPRICTALNLYEELHLIEDDQVVETCRITARGKNQ